MSPTQTAPDLLSSLKTGWNDAMQQWWDQSQTAFEPWRQAWETVLPGTAEPRGSMPSHHHGAHYSSHHRGPGPCGCQVRSHETCGHETCGHAVDVGNRRATRYGLERRGPYHHARERAHSSVDSATCRLTPGGTRHAPVASLPGRSCH